MRYHITRRTRYISSAGSRLFSLRWPGTGPILIATWFTGLSNCRTGLPTINFKKNVRENCIKLQQFNKIDIYLCF